VAPDEGALGRCQAVRTAVGIGHGNIPYFEKHRMETGITHGRLIGEVGRRAVVIDDILDTGDMLVSACEKLNQAGAEDISVMVTHGLFTGDRWKKLWQLGVKRILCTNSVPPRPSFDENNIEGYQSLPFLNRSCVRLPKSDQRKICSLLDQCH
jgi:ribose-phosphate pyrophosphokinase